LTSHSQIRVNVAGVGSITERGSGAAKLGTVDTVTMETKTARLLPQVGEGSLAKDNANEDGLARGERCRLWSDATSLFFSISTSQRCFWVFLSDSDFVEGGEGACGDAGRGEDCVGVCCECVGGTLCEVGSGGHHVMSVASAMPSSSWHPGCCWKTAEDTGFLAACSETEGNTVWVCNLLTIHHPYKLLKWAAVGTLGDGTLLPDPSQTTIVQEGAEFEMGERIDSVEQALNPK
jgi:hypothetical protein